MAPLACQAVYRIKSRRARIVLLTNAVEALLAIVSLIWRLGKAWKHFYNSFLCLVLLMLKT